MSKMSDLMIEIQQRLEMGEQMTTIARELEIPLQWVEEAAKNL